MRRKKLDDYRAHFAELGHAGILYLPLIISCYGRLHPETGKIIDYLAAEAAKRVGTVGAQQLAQRCRAHVGVAIWRRAAAMLSACLPPLSKEALALLGEGSNTQL